MEKGAKLVLDPGSDTLKAGFASDDVPSLVCRDLVYKVEESDDKVYGGDVIEIDLPGHECAHITELHPVEHGIVVKMDVMQDIFDKALANLDVNSNECSILIAESPINPNYLRERMCEIMFEYFEVSSLCIQDSSVLSLLSSGLSTGTVIESGDSSTYTSVVYGGSVLKDAIPKTFYAGSSLTKYLAHLVSKRKGETCSEIPLSYLKTLKEKLAFVSEDYDADLKLAKATNLYEREYTLPDGEIITVNEERLKCGEGLFVPQMYGCSCPGIHLQVHRTLELVDSHIRKTACRNIVLSGGNTMFSGLAMRLQIEMNKLFPSKLGVKVIESPVSERRFATWVGGSIMASLDSMKDKWVSKHDFMDQGPQVINKETK
ncbi:hypothetical protein ACF0H5_003321 [Mactra antiquata]